MCGEETDLCCTDVWCGNELISYWCVTRKRIGVALVCGAVGNGLVSHWCVTRKQIGVTLVCDAEKNCNSSIGLGARGFCSSERIECTRILLTRED